jgi:EAL domain
MVITGLMSLRTHLIACRKHSGRTALMRRAMLWLSLNLYHVKRGVQWLDDDGNGLDTIKIDRSFMMQQTASNSNWSIVSAMKQLADSMGMAVTVEGVENEFQLAELENLGCQFGQGWLFEKPISEAEALKLLALG